MTFDNDNDVNVYFRQVSLTTPLNSIMFLLVIFSLNNFWIVC